MSNQEIQLWVQGGETNTFGTLWDAGAYVWHNKCLEYYLWEVRTPGTSIEDGELFFNTLGEAVDHALPEWEKIGIAYKDAAMLALTSGLILSTGIPVREDEDE